MSKGALFFLGFVLALSLLRIALAKPLERTRWFKTNSFRLALWAAGWGLIVIALGPIFRLSHDTVELIAAGPIVIILLSMFLLVMIEIPAFWYAEIRSLFRFFRSDR